MITVMTHIFGERHSGASPLPAVRLQGGDKYDGQMAAVWITPERKLNGVSKRYMQRIERHNLNLRLHLARLGRTSM